MHEQASNYIGHSALHLYCEAATNGANGFIIKKRLATTLLVSEIRVPPRDSLLAGQTILSQTRQDVIQRQERCSHRIRSSMG